MKRIAIVTCALAMAAGTANAQGLTMQMSNGWNFSFSGNVNAFLVYTDPTCSTVVAAGAGGTAPCSFAGGTWWFDGVQHRYDAEWGDRGDAHGEAASVSVFGVRLRITNR